MDTIRFSDFWTLKFATPVSHLFTKSISQRIGAIVAYWAYKANFSPNTLTLIGLAAMLGASLALGLSPEMPTSAFLALVLYQFGFGIDCADGQLARATNCTSNFGFWLDHACDQIRAVSTLLAIGVIVLSDKELPGILLISSLLLLGSGVFVYSHTALILMRSDYPLHGLRGAKNILKTVVINFTDAPVFMLVICLLATAPKALAVYAVAVGALSLLQAIALAILRIK